MSHSNNENSPGGDSGDFGDFQNGNGSTPWVWSEFAWQRYLKRTDADIESFVQWYIKLEFQPGRIDAIAELFGWHRAFPEGEEPGTPAPGELGEREEGDEHFLDIPNFKAKPSASSSNKQNAEGESGLSGPSPLHSLNPADAWILSEYGLTEDFDLADASDLAGEKGTDGENIPDDVIKPMRLHSQLQTHNARDPYTLHRHPLHVISTGLIEILSARWESCIDAEDIRPGARLSWAFQKSLANVQRYTILALSMVDMEEPPLAIAEIKRTLGAMNQVIGYINMLVEGTQEKPENVNSSTAAAAAACRHVAYDLRDMWLRTLSECRMEAEGGEDF